MSSLDPDTCFEPPRPSRTSRVLSRVPVLMSDDDRASSAASRPVSTLEFLIPTYKRPHTVLRAATSVTRQVEALGLGASILVTVQDDASPDVDIDALRASARESSPLIRLRRNERNLGMSANILSMVERSEARFCTVLTDDDYLQEGALARIVERLEALTSGPEPAVSAVFTPRFSYTEDGALHCVVCNPAERSFRIEPSPEAALRYAWDGFILTGLLFRPDRVDTALWREHVDNAFFPVIYFGRLLLSEPAAYVHENWFSHTVLNECHWEAWGETERERLARLFTDYLLAVKLVGDLALDANRRRRAVPGLLALQGRAYERQVRGMVPKLGLARSLRAIPWRALATSLAFAPALAVAGVDLSAAEVRRRLEPPLRRGRRRLRSWLQR